MKVKSVIKLFKGSVVNICNNHGALLVAVYVDDDTDYIFVLCERIGKDDNENK